MRREVSLLRVLVIDDSAFSRVSIGKMLESDGRIKVVGYANNGEEGLRKLLELNPDVVTLDLEMPRIGGFGLLRLIMEHHPVPVIVVSSQSERQDVFKALELGAFDFIAKPAREKSSDLYSIEQDLQHKVCQAAQLSVEKLKRKLPPETLPQLKGATRVRHPSGVLIIGASTGGPPALHHLFASLKRPLPIPVAVAQHMPAGFTRSFAQRLNDSSVMEVREAEDGDRMLPGQVLICPGNKNLELQYMNSLVQVRVVEPPRAQIYTPSVNVLFQTAAQVYGSKTLGVVLTGMGNDGSEGVRAVAARGGQVLAESEESCVVYGMPKEALQTGLVEKAVPLEKMLVEIESRCAPY
jgi:two-component system, chemotaxis family, protein-glutamate methylesterase/glutaminase